MLDNIIHERGYVYNFHFHIVWVTKYRKPIFASKQYVSDMTTIIKNIAETNDIIIEQMEIMPEHVHLLVSFKPKMTPANIVKTLKGVSARLWFKTHPETKSMLWGGHLWSNSYYMSTLGDMSKAVIENYINNQRTEKSNRGKKPMNRQSNSLTSRH